MADRPGELVKFITHLEKLQVNILYINHVRADRSVALGETRVEMDVETRNQEHVQEVARHLRQAGYKIEIK